MAEEEQRLNALWLELMEIGSEPSGSDFLRQLQIQSELEYLEDGFYLVLLSQYRSFSRRLFDLT